MKRLAIDIETSPNIGDVWSLWNQNISLSQLRESTRLLCFAAQWEGGDVEFYSEWGNGREEMVRAAYKLLCEADAIVHYNGIKFDRRHLNREMREVVGFPPSPYKQIDLLREVKREFSFPSYKLEYVAQALGVGSKVKHEGHELWVKVMAGDRKAQIDMERYCCQDTALLFPVWYKVRPWIANPSVGAMTGEDVCPTCGSEDLRREGHAFLLTGKYQRYQCRECGTWSRGTRRVSGTGITRVAS